MKSTIAAAVFVACVAGVVFWRVLTVTGRALGILTTPVDRIAADWDAQKVPFGDREITFVISDARTEGNPFAFQRQPPWSEQIADWVKSRTLPGNVAVDSTALMLPFKTGGPAVTWSHDGFSAVTPDEMVVEIKQALVRAARAHARVTVVAQGASGGAVLEALEGLESEKVGADKVFLVGINRGRLRAQGWKVGSQSPANVKELAELYQEGRMFGGARLDLSTPGAETRTEPLDNLKPGLSGGDAKDLGRWISGLSSQNASITQQIQAGDQKQQDAAARAQADEAERQRRIREENEEVLQAARTRQTVAPARQPPAALASAPARAPQTPDSPRPEPSTYRDSGEVAPPTPKRSDEGGPSLPLHCKVAANEGDIPEFERCLKDGTDINARYAGDAALHGAVVGHQAPMVRFLLEHGADVNIKTTDGETPLDFVDRSLYVCADKQPPCDSNDVWTDKVIGRILTAHGGKGTQEFPSTSSPSAP